MDWHRRTSLTSVDQSQPSAADKDSDQLLVATTHFGTNTGSEQFVRSRWHYRYSFISLTIQIAQARCAVVMTLSCYGALEIVGVIITNG